MSGVPATIQVENPIQTLFCKGKKLELECKLFIELESSNTFSFNLVIPMFRYSSNYQVLIYNYLTMTYNCSVYDQIETPFTWGPSGTSMPANSLNNEQMQRLYFDCPYERIDTLNPNNALLFHGNLTSLNPENEALGIFQQVKKLFLNNTL